MEVFAALHDRGLFCGENSYFLPSDEIPPWLAGLTFQCLTDELDFRAPRVGSIQMTTWNVFTTFLDKHGTET